MHRSIARLLEKLGWLTNRWHDVPFEDPAFLGATFTLRPLVDQGPALEVLRVKDGIRAFWIEYRVPKGPDLGAPASRGVIVRVEEYGGSRSVLLDMTPGTDQEFRDAPLPVEQAWQNLLGRLRITVLSQDSAGAHVRIDGAPGG